MPVHESREEVFEHRGTTLRILMPRAADELIDEQAFERDERLPFWADLWPSAKALTRWLLDHPPPKDQRIVELGCGLALPSIALARSGHAILATDYEPDALEFAGINAQRNGAAIFRTGRLDWREGVGDFGLHDLVIAADVLYEQRQAIALADLVPKLVAQGGSLVLADPGRRWAPQFQLLMKQQNWTCRELAELEERGSGVAAASRVRIVEWKRAGPTPTSQD